MPKKRRQVCEIIKVPSDRKLSSNEPNFPPLSRLYLELIENKDKIKQDLINKEFKVPDDEVIDLPKEDKPKKKKNGYSVDTPDDSPKSSPDTHKEEKVKDSPNKNSDNELEVQTDNSPKTSPSKEEKPNEDKDDLKDHIKNLFRDDKGKKPSKVSLRHSSSEDEAPTLKELEKKGVYTNRYRNLDQDHTNQDEEDLKREVKFKYDLLRKKYKTEDIPELSIHTEYSVMQKKYESTLRSLALNRNVEQYKKYLTIGFAMIELSLGKLNFDMTDYTQHCLTNMDDYEILLIEMSEKSYMPEATQWPVEIRLVFLILFNTASFVFMNMLAKKVGVNFGNKIQPEKPKRKMKGPDINLDDLPEVSA